MFNSFKGISKYSQRQVQGVQLMKQHPHFNHSGTSSVAMAQINHDKSLDLSNLSRESHPPNMKHHQFMIPMLEIPDQSTMVSLNGAV